jgi:hypothetical protein
MTRPITWLTSMKLNVIAGSLPSVSQSGPNHPPSAFGHHAVGVHCALGSALPFANLLHDIFDVDATEVHASDLTLDKFLDEATLAAAPSLPGPSSEVRTVLLTGATGSLGRNTKP